MNSKVDEPRCSNCPHRANCPRGRQLCDHVCCTAHPRNDAYYYTAKSANWREAHEERDTGAAILGALVALVAGAMGAMTLLLAASIVTGRALI